MSKKIAVLVTDQFEDTSPAEAEKEVTGRPGEKVKVDQAISDAGEFANERPDGFTKHAQRFDQCRGKFYKGEEAGSHHILTSRNES
ncbi:hypothetical protein SRCM101294_02783 [Bacillus amyloliquefaciens]|nr:hypothetical protein [Bacillus amyloliquefaciens]OCB93421.1 hypothetical protein SRCM101294_02783 [Bacillus amyloliquefaciens]